MSTSIASQHDLDAEESLRYSRQILLPEFGAAGQNRLKDARVLVAGVGGLGSPVIQYLAAAGVGTIGMIDDDYVDSSNLQRQVIHSTSKVGMGKAESARLYIQDLNPLVAAIPLHKRLTPDNALEVISGFDAVIDGTDDFATRYLISDACTILAIPHVWGSVYQYEGQTAVFMTSADDESAPCLRDLYATPPPAHLAPSCAEGGVFGFVCAAIGVSMATETVKLLAGIGTASLGYVRTYDALAGEWGIFPIIRDPDRDPVRALSDYEALCGISHPPQSRLLSVDDVVDALSESKTHTLVDIRETSETELGMLPGAINIPFSRPDLSSRIEELARTGIVILYCEAGSRSHRAAVELAERGVSNLAELRGGMRAWRAHPASQIGMRSPLTPPG